MIISVSYRTDIPAFYGPWFVNRWRAGFVKVRNPYGGPASTVALRQGVDGVVFWTRNATRFHPALHEVRQAGIPFVVSYTVTDYPRQLESSVIAAAQAVADIRALAATFGPRAVVWRYDPILVTGATSAGFHRDTFARLADGVAGAVDEAVVSFATIYRKTARNLNAAGVVWDDPPDDDKRRLIAVLAQLAGQRGIALSICSQDRYGGADSRPAACIDARRLEDVAAGWGVPRVIAARRKGNRPDCGCHESRDIGDYDSCPHGCVYCYAVGSPVIAKRRHGQHDPHGDFLIPDQP